MTHPSAAGASKALELGDHALDLRNLAPT